MSGDLWVKQSFIPGYIDFKNLVVHTPAWIKNGITQCMGLVKKSWLADLMMMMMILNWNETDGGCSTLICEQVSNQMKVYFREDEIRCSYLLPVGELPKVQSTEQIVLMSAAVCLVDTLFFVVAKTRRIANFRLKSLSFSESLYRKLLITSNPKL